MKIALVLCPCWGTNLPPLNITYLAGYLKSLGHNVFLFDFNIKLYSSLDDEKKEYWKTGKLEYIKYWQDEESLENNIGVINGNTINSWADQILKTKAEIIAFSISLQTRATSIILAEEIKKRDRNKIIVFGGPDLFFESPRRRSIIESGLVDFIVTGEGEETMGEIVKKTEEAGTVGFCRGAIIIKGEKIVDCGAREPVHDLDRLPFPDFEELNLELYDNRDAITILMSRGCVNRCVFCSERVAGGFYRCRSAENVVAEIKKHKERYNRNTFVFNDSLINGNISELERLCDILINEGINIRFVGNAIITPKMTFSLLKKMRNAGCFQLCYGVESAAQRVLDKMKKNFKVRDAKEVLYNTHKAGIRVITNWILGFPGETNDDFNKTLDFIKENKGFIEIGPPWGNPFVLLNNSYINTHRGEFGISEKQDGEDWVSTDGKNTKELREKRAKIFRDLCGTLNLNAFT